VDPNLQRKIVEAVDPLPDDEVLEIGPGRGALTRHLAGTCRLLTLVEVDDDLVAALERVYGARDDVRIVHRSILDAPIADLSATPQELKVVGNIPYNLTSHILFHVLARPRPRSIVLMVQREVGERILGEPGTKAYGALSVGVRTVADAERLFRVPPGAFRPVPRVDSVVLRITPHAPPRLNPSLEGAVRTLTKAAFGWRRKQFQRILRDHPDYGLESPQIRTLEEAAEVDLTRRPEAFDPETFVRIAEALSDLEFPRDGGVEP
jgi:16S rRNA (adenine1518-N6/adenine1519-N6)-dimethyltransferase